MSGMLAVKTQSYRWANDGVLQKASQPDSSSRLKTAIQQRLTDHKDR
jgi:hypothetical protein